MAVSGLISIGGSSTTMTGATNILNGAGGVVPQPFAGDEAKVLSGAGTWVSNTTSSIIRQVTQAAHGFVVGDWVYLTGTVYAKTDADLVASADSLGVVSSVSSINNFTITTDGYVTGLTGLVAGTRYYISGTAGEITAIAPTNVKAVFIADTTTSGYVQQYSIGASAPAVYGQQVLVGGASVPTSSTGAGNATDIMSFVLPSAGVWDVNYIIRATTPNQTSSSSTGMVALVTNNSNVLVADSEIAIARVATGNSSGNFQSLTTTGHGFVRITTIGAETFKIRGHHDGTNNGNLAFAVQNDGNGTTKVYWNKIA